MKQELYIWFYTPARIEEFKLLPLYEDYWLSDKYCPKNKYLF